MKKCPICGSGELKKGEIEEELFGISLGRYNAGCSPLIVGVFILSLFTPNVIIKNDK